MKRTQTHRQLAIATPLGDDVLMLASMHGAEQLGALFEYELFLISEKHDLELADLVSQNVTVRLARGDGETRYFNGHVSKFAAVTSDDLFAHYRATMVPWLWFLTRTADCCIFQEMTVPEIVKQVLREHGVGEFIDALSGSYAKLTYCVQYRETDFAFLSRLMEQEGIYYFFEHENGRHLMVLADGYSSHSVIPGCEKVPYYPPQQNERRSRDYLDQWTTEQQAQPGEVALNDFDFKVPKKNLHARSAAEHASALKQFEVFDYPGEYQQTAEGSHYSRVRMEHLQSRCELSSGSGDARGLTPGGLFSLANHPREKENREYLVVAMSHVLRSDDFETGGAGGGPICQCRCTVIESRTPYRPARLTPRPMIHGPQTAMVVGKAGEEIWTDEFGRVKVQFHWDRYGKADENASCWVRVSQAWAGKKWGFITLPRIGQEVIIEFEDGDPDSPIITGRVYNGESKPPYELPANATISTWKSYSSKGGCGFNEIRYEDKKGEEQVFIHAQKNCDVRVKNDCFQTVERCDHLVVKSDSLEHIGYNRHEVVGKDHKEHIKGDRHLGVCGKQAVQVGGSHSFVVKGEVIEVFKANHSEQVTGDRYLKASNIVVEAQSISLASGGNYIVIDSSGISIIGSKVTIQGGQVLINTAPGSPAGMFSPPCAVPPCDPYYAEEADKADPGEMAKVKKYQAENKQGKYGKTPAKPYVPQKYGAPAPPGGNGMDHDGPKKKLVWIEIELVDEADKPVPGEAFRITLPDGSVVEGTLDEKGFARVDGIDPGVCQVTFPKLDEPLWEHIA